jgi:hypothetical protein
MRSGNAFLLWVVFSLVLNGCGSNPAAVSTPTASTWAPAPPAVTIVPPAPTLTPTIPKGETIVVTSAGDSGPGTLRQALVDAEPGDVITFDTQVFPPGKPTTIFLINEDGDSALPPINQGGVTIDASNAGVILDGSKATGDWVNGLEIYSDGNTIQGLQVVNFTGSGIVLCGGSHNTIGGDRRIGAGPLGRGNLSSKNGTGVDLGGNGTSFNTILGNLIGTDPTGTYELPVQDFRIHNEWGNKYAGIWLEDGATRNVIGPGNTIAFNHYDGIKMNGGSTYGNTVTHNSVHDNAGAGIQLSSGSNGGLSAPVIASLELDKVVGTACANCVVEIYSDDNSEGRVFEGGTTTDAAGSFAFDKGSPFTRPRVTATATDPKGNTSGFSRSVGPIALLQTGNDRPRAPIQPRSSGELADNRIGSHWHSLYFVTDPELQDMLDENLALGVKRFRLAINNSDSNNVDLFWEEKEFEIDPKYDEFITELADHGVRVTYLLSFWDKDYQNAGGKLSFPRFHTEDQIQRYLDYVKFIVGHFKDRVQYYEIWNEPSISSLPMQWIRVDDYIDLVKQTIPVIRREYPAAKIVVGSTHGLSEQDSRDYLFAILNSDLMPLVDVVAWHPLYGASPEYDDALRRYYYGYPSLVQEIKDAASSHGFKGEFVADELYWHPPETAISGDPWTGASTEVKAAKYTARGILIDLGLDVSVTVQETGNIRRPPLVSFTLQNLAATLAGNKPVSLPITIQGSAANVKSCGFSLPNGDSLLAVWNDGAAVDDDPGISSTVTIPGFAGWKAAGIDVLNGFEQELVTASDDGDLVIRDFLLKDYPILIRLSK